jgi:peptidyl-tRNA hydrolase, PTH1 family
MDSKKKRLIIGLGNPGESYKSTRHNVGFMIADAFAHKKGLSFKHASHVLGELAQGMLEETQVFILKPMTFMNESGAAVRRCVDYYKVALEDLIVIADDAALPLGMMRMRTKGSCGGHNGLLSIETHVNTQDYPRFRIGIGGPPPGRMKDYVLTVFSSEESRIIEETIVQAVHALELWITAGIAAAMQMANQKIEGNGGCCKT